MTGRRMLRAVDLARCQGWLACDVMVGCCWVPAGDAGMAEEAEDGGLRRRPYGRAGRGRRDGGGERRGGAGAGGRVPGCTQPGPQQSQPGPQRRDGGGGGRRAGRGSAHTKERGGDAGMAEGSDGGEGTHKGASARMVTAMGGISDGLQGGAPGPGGGCWEPLVWFGARVALVRSHGWLLLGPGRGRRDGGGSGRRAGLRRRPYGRSGSLGRPGCRRPPIGGHPRGAPLGGW